MSLCERCGNYPNICGCADVDILSAKLSRHEHWIADLTREAEALLSFIDGKTHTQEKDDQIYSQAEESERRSMSSLSSMDHSTVPLLHPLGHAQSMGKMASKIPVPAGSEAAIHWYQPTPEI